MPTPLPFVATTPPSHRYGPALPLIRPQANFPQPPFLMIGQHPPTINYPYKNTFPRRRARAMAHEIYPVRSLPMQASQSPTRAYRKQSQRPTALILKARVSPSATTHGVMQWTTGPNFMFNQFTNPVIITTDHGVYVHNVSTPLHHTFQPAASSCSLGQLEKDCVEEGREKDLPLECLHFPIHHRFTERFWHLSKYVFALAGRQNN